MWKRVGRPAGEVCGAGFGFAEDGQGVPLADAPLADVRDELDRVLLEMGVADSWEVEVERRAGERAQKLVATVLAELIDPAITVAECRKRTLTICYAHGFPGLPPMGEVGRMYGMRDFEKAAVSQRCREYVERYGLPPSFYMKSEGAVQEYRAKNRRNTKAKVK